MADDKPNLDDPDVAFRAEVVKNRIYRGAIDPKVGIEPEDLNELSKAMDSMTEEEQMELGRISIELEREDRGDLEFDELTDTEREYFDLLERALDRHRREEQ